MVRKVTCNTCNKIAEIMHWLSVAFMVCHCVRSDEVELTPRSGRQSYVSGNHNILMALDGNPSTFASTLGGNDTEYGGWIQFDLGGIFNIRRVALTNAPDIESQYLINFQILVGTTNQVIPELQTCSVYANLPQVLPGSTHYSTCQSEPLLGRYVTVLKHAGPSKGSLVIAEFRVFVIPQTPAENLATSDKQVRQSSSDFDSFTANMATDGNLYTCAFTATESVSRRNLSGWWQIDLGGAYEVTACLVVNVQKEYFSPYQYMDTFAILVSNNSKVEYDESNLCHLQNSTSSKWLHSGNALYLPCGRSRLVGRYVTVLNLVESLRKDALSLCEFLVIYSSEPLEPLPVTTTLTTLESTTESWTTVPTTIVSTTVRSTVHSTSTSTFAHTTTQTHPQTTKLQKSSYPTTSSLTTSVFPTFVSTANKAQSSTILSSTLYPTPAITSYAFYTTVATSSGIGPTESIPWTHFAEDISTTYVSSEIEYTSLGLKTVTTANNSLSGSIRNDSTSVVGLAVGLGVGLGILLLVALILILVYFLCIAKRKATEGKNRKNNDTYEKRPYSDSVFVHPRTGLSSPRVAAFKGVNLSYIPDLAWVPEDSQV